MLGICNKAGKLAIGNDATIEAIKKNKAELVIIASDLSRRTAQEVREIAIRNKVVVVDVPERMHDFGSAIGKTSGVICITDEGITKKIKTLIN